MSKRIHAQNDSHVLSRLEVFNAEASLTCAPIASRNHWLSGTDCGITSWIRSARNPNVLPLLRSKVSFHFPLRFESHSFMIRGNELGPFLSLNFLARRHRSLRPVGRLGTRSGSRTGSQPTPQSASGRASQPTNRPTPHNCLGVLTAPNGGLSLI